MNHIIDNSDTSVVNVDIALAIWNPDVSKATIELSDTLGPLTPIGLYWFLADPNMRIICFC